MVRRVIALVNVSLVLSILLVVFTLLNWRDLHYGLAGFLGMRITIKNLLVTAIFLCGCILIFRVFNLTGPMLSAPLWKEFSKGTQAAVAACLLATIYPLTSHSGAFSFRVILYSLPIVIAACLSGRLVGCACVKPLTRGLKGRHDVIIVGSGPRAINFYKRVQSPSPEEFRVLGFVDSPNGHVVPLEIQRRMLGTLDDLEAVLMRQSVDEVVITLPAKSCYTQIQTAIRTCERAGVEAKVDVCDLFQVSRGTLKVDVQMNTPVVSLKVVQDDDSRFLLKRCIDVAGSAIGLILCGPLILLLAAAIRLTSPGPAFFAQERYGYRKRLFRMYKLRTMVARAEELQATLEAQNEAQGPVFKIRKDPRITPLGRFLRRTSLDELPQLFNVLRGEMSLVGPRPLPKRDVSKFDDASLMRRFSMKPGLTCLWQVKGRSDTSFDRWIQLDLNYIDNWSLGLDFEILARTLPAVIKGSGAV